MKVVKTKLYYGLGDMANKYNFNERFDTELGDYDGSCLIKAFYDKNLTKNAGLFSNKYINIQNRNKLNSGIVDNYLKETLCYYKPRATVNQAEEKQVFEVNALYKDDTAKVGESAITSLLKVQFVGLDENINKTNVVITYDNAGTASWNKYKIKYLRRVNVKQFVSQ